VERNPAAAGSPDPATRTVLQVLPRLDTGGVERGTVEVARALAAAGWRPLVAAEPGRLVGALEAAGGAFVALPLSAKNPLTIARNARRIASLVRAEGVGLVHARSRAPAWSARAAAAATGRPFVTTFHGVYGGGGNPLKRRYNAVMAAGERVIAVSEHVAAHVRAVYGVGADRLRVVHRGVDLAVFDPARVAAEAAAGARRAWGVPARARVVLLVGRLTRLKGHLALLEAVARLKRGDVHIVAVGPYAAENPYVAEVRRRARELGLADRLHLAGPVDDMPTAYASADVVACPSRMEAFGRVSIEAQAMARPAVVHRVGGLPETVLEGRTGWTVEPGDAPGFARALERSLDLATAGDRAFAEQARRFVGERYALNAMTDATLAIYRELLSPAPARRPSTACK
jgi:glycosyltransferase involved in cell wall biosynthesis